MEEKSTVGTAQEGSRYGQDTTKLNKAALDTVKAQSTKLSFERDVRLSDALSTVYALIALVCSFSTARLQDDGVIPNSTTLTITKRFDRSTVNAGS